MATFTNFATLSYNGTTTNSNIVTGEIIEALTATKTALNELYEQNGEVTYIVSLTNTSALPLSNLTVTDNLGGYTFGADTVYPLSFDEGSVRLFIDGVIQATPAVTAGPPMVISGINIPAGSNAVIVYSTNTTAYAPLADASQITNTVTVTGSSLTAPVTAQETVTITAEPYLSITKSVSPSVVTENGQITYTFVIENSGNVAIVSTDDVVLSDTFDPALTGITVTYNGTVWTAGTNYTYDEATGVFSTIPGQITVDSAAFTQNADGSWIVTPASSVITVTGTI